MTKINIFSGFLGAGKTTLIQKLINEGFNDKICLIENEFGEIAIDGGFMKEAGVQVKEINSGCICCSLVGDFEESLKQVMETYNPDRIIIEPSGVGKLSDVKIAVSKVCNDDVVIEGSIAVVHAKKCKMYARNYGEFFIDQIAHADCIVLSRSQDVNEKKLQETIDIIREHNPKAPIVTTPWDKISGEQILDALHHSELLNVDEVAEEHHHHHHHDHECDDPECGCHEHEHHDHDHNHHHDHEHHHHDEHEHHHDHDHECDDPNCGCHDHDHEHHHHDHDHHHHHHADDVFGSWGQETTKKFTIDELKDILAELVNADEYGVILRAKGIVMSANDGEWLHFNYVPGESSVVTGAADYTGRFCVIGSKLQEGSLKELFLGE
ncbi:CobW family GTP-binding protein [Anaerovibrio lipolyticus]|uniref:CobW family GTP-binding protein n=1 Tax=Anaerovibrio lipolyticus TaxID=82374 RepID=UPI000489B91B|nr:CobW family GTP-binding protein [Anaerovibrio lipolyticus]